MNTIADHVCHTFSSNWKKTFFKLRWKCLGAKGGGDHFGLMAFGFFMPDVHWWKVLPTLVEYDDTTPMSANHSLYSRYRWSDFTVLSIVQKRLVFEWVNCQLYGSTQWVPKILYYETHIGAQIISIVQHYHPVCAFGDATGPILHWCRFCVNKFPGCIVFYCHISAVLAGEPQVIYNTNVILSKYLK